MNHTIHIFHSSKRWTKNGIDDDCFHLTRDAQHDDAEEEINSFAGRICYLYLFCHCMSNSSTDVNRARMFEEGKIITIIINARIY